MDSENGYALPETLSLPAPFAPLSRFKVLAQWPALAFEKYWYHVLVEINIEKNKNWYD